MLLSIKSSTKPAKLKLIFMGTPDFAVPALEALLKMPGSEIVGVFTQTDKAVGRGRVISAPPIKELAIKNSLSVFQPLKIKDELENIKNLHPDLIIVAAYGKIIPQSILDIPTYGCINIHASLLPKYRGAACLNAPILNGDKETGVTIMKMEAGLDTGPILKQAKIPLNSTETLEFVHDKLSALGAEILIPTIDDFIAGKIKPIIQDESLATYVKTLSKDDGRINFNQSAQEIERMIRAYNPWPGTYGFNKQELIKIIEVDKIPLKINNYKVGELFIDSGRLTVQCGQDALVILRLQTAGKKVMTSGEFLRGHKLEGLLE